MEIKEINVMVIGIGHHARRIYLPALKKYQAAMPVKIYGLDITPARELIDTYLKERDIQAEMIFIDPLKDTEQFPSEIEQRLDNFVKNNRINSVIISTDPTTHKIYANWAVKNKLHILMDKPITTQRGVAINSNQAKKLITDYREILDPYLNLQKEKRTIFSVNTQRRYELGYQKVFSLIREVADRFDVPVTSIQAGHSDGVWIFPDEIVEQNSHPYNEGYGKCSHSGFHLFDIVWQFYKAGAIDSKKPDMGEVYSSFLNPDGSLIQINQADYRKYFGEAYNTRPRRKEIELNQLFKDYGENDAFSIVRLMKENKNICNISIDLLHNSFSRRSWVEPAKDLYKGNGRIKHQYYHIQQGPFQCIQIHNYQSNDQQEVNTEADYKLGGNNHFDIYVFRNDRMFGGGTKPLEILTLPDIAEKDFSGSELYHEAAKHRAVLQFLSTIVGDFDINKSTSPLESYDVPVKIMSSIYQSNVKYRQGENPLIKFDINE